MRAVLSAFLITLLTYGALAAPETWKPTGTIDVNGKKIQSATFMQQGRHMVFPLQAVASALGRTVAFDEHAGTVAWNGGKPIAVRSLTVIGGVAYVSWIDMSRLEPGLEFGMRGDEAVFALNARKQMPTGSNSSVTAGGPVLEIINKSNPGMQIDVRAHIVPDHYTIVEFFSEN